MMNETTRKMMTAQLMELREKEKAASGLAEYLQNQILNWENSMIQLGILVPDHNDNHPHHPEGEALRITAEEMANRDVENRDVENRDVENREVENREVENREAENREAENREAENREVENRTPTATPEPKGTQTNYVHVPGHRMQQLYHMNGDDMTQAEKRELN